MIPDLEVGLLKELELWLSAVGSQKKGFLFCMSWEDAVTAKDIPAESKRGRNTLVSLLLSPSRFHHCLNLSRSQLARETSWQENGVPCDVEQRRRKGRKRKSRVTNTQYHWPYKPPGRLISGGASLWPAEHKIIIQCRWIQYRCLFWHYFFRTVKSNIFLWQNESILQGLSQRILIRCYWVGI